ncbi:MAG TPA: type II secretion system protein GspM [Myxococcales bacterium]|jgi:type II secretory pathway component PulM|nr:type II secretion system protein GspM [Myxococcales bacterium]
MEKLRALLADAVHYVQNASPRERRLLLFAGAGAVLFILLVLWAAFGSAIRRHDDSLEEKRTAFEKVQRLSAGYAQQERERQLLEARLRQSPPALMGFVDGLARQEGVEIGSMADRGVVSGGQNGRPRESSVEVSLGKVPLDKLMRLLQSIEQSPGVVRVRKLRLRKSLDNKDTLDVTMTVSAWQAA